MAVFFISFCEIFRASKTYRWSTLTPTVSVNKFVNRVTFFSCWSTVRICPLINMILKGVEQHVVIECVGDTSKMLCWSTHVFQHVDLQYVYFNRSTAHYRPIIDNTMYGVYHDHKNYCTLKWNIYHPRKKYLWRPFFKKLCYTKKCILSKFKKDM